MTPYTLLQGVENLCRTILLKGAALLPNKEVGIGTGFIEKEWRGKTHQALWPCVTKPPIIGSTY